MLDFVVDLVEERVDLGGSQFSESILERWFSAFPCSPRSQLLAHDSLSRSVVSNVE